MFTIQQIPKPGMFNTQNNRNIGIVTIINEKQPKQIQPEIISLAVSPLESVSTIVSSSMLYEALYSTIKNVTKYKLAEEILKNVDDKLKEKIFKDVYLSKVLIQSMVKIKKYLDKLNKDYQLKAILWHDFEDSNWEENVISVKIDYKNNNEKRKIWDIINKIVEENEDKGIIFLTNVDKYEL